MIIVIPFTGKSDYTDTLSAKLIKHGGLGGHRLVVPAAPDDLSAAEEFTSSVRSQFVEATVINTNASGATQTKLFRDGVVYAAQINPGQEEIPNHPILWLEPGYTPVKDDWADALQSAFFNSGGGQKILGEWDKLPDREVGNGSARHTLAGGWAPKGPAVFPAAYIRATEMIYQLNAQSSPWREVLQFVVTPHRAEAPQLSSDATSLLSLAEAPEETEDTATEAPARRAAVRRSTSAATSDTTP